MAVLAKTKLDRLKPDKKSFIIWDRGRLSGFCAKVLPTGRVVFILDARIDGRSRRLTLGRYGPLTLDGARKLASDRLRDVSEGRDPTADRRAARAVPTVAELCDVYLEAAAAGLVPTRFGRPKKPSTVAIDQGLVARHIKPLIGNIRADRLTRPDVQRMIDAIAAGKTAIDQRTKARGRARVTGGGGIATRTAELLGGIWNWGSKRGHVKGPSPTTGTDRFRGAPTHRRLSSAQLRKLGETIRQCENEWRNFEERRRAAHDLGKRGPTLPPGLISPAALAICRLIATTALRHGEASALRWSEIDVARQTILLGDSKTGQSWRPLGTAAITVLDEIPRISDEWVFPASRGQGSASFKKALATLFKRAGIDATPNSLRSTFASIAADLGYSSGTIGDMLGHARQGVTERHYIRRIDAVLIAAADGVSKAVDRSMATPN